MSIAWLLSVSALIAGIPERDANGLPHLRSETVLVRFADTNEIVLSKNPDQVRPIASVTKLLTALVMSKKQLAPPEWITIEEADKDRLKWSRSRLPIGKRFKAEDLYRTALIASDNRAVYAFVRASGVERSAFVEEMNHAAQELGMTKSAFVDPAGVDPANVSTASDLLKLIDAVMLDERATSACRTSSISLLTADQKTLRLANTNRLLRSPNWTVLLGKTGYTVEAGRSLVMRVSMNDRPVDMVFLGSREMQSIFGDAGRVRRWLVEKLEKTSALAGKPASPNP